jgi:hypothetical protein
MVRLRRIPAQRFVRQKVGFLEKLTACLQAPQTKHIALRSSFDCSLACVSGAEPVRATD